MSNSVILHQTSMSEFKAMIGDVVAEQLKKHQGTPPAKELTILTRRQTATMLGITLPTLHQWTKTGVIQGTRVGTLVRYRLADVEAALQDIRNIKYSRKQG